MGRGMGSWTAELMSEKETERGSGAASARDSEPVLRLLAKVLCRRKRSRPSSLKSRPLRLRHSTSAWHRSLFRYRRPPPWRIRSDVKGASLNQSANVPERDVVLCLLVAGVILLNFISGVWDTNPNPARLEKAAQ